MRCRRIFSSRRRATSSSRRWPTSQTTRVPGRGWPSSGSRSAISIGPAKRRSAPRLCRRTRRAPGVLGFAALARVDISAATTAFERAIALESDNPLARLGLGLAKIRDGHLAEGRREIEIAAALSPDDSDRPQLPRQGVFRGKARDAIRRSVRTGEEARSARPDAVVLRRDPQADDQPARRSLAGFQKSIDLNGNRAVYRSGSCSIRISPRAARAWAGSTATWVRTAGARGGMEIARRRSRRPLRPPLSGGYLLRAAAARGRPGQRTASGTAAAADQPHARSAAPR